jgi:hypothetical protein
MQEKENCLSSTGPSSSWMPVRYSLLLHKTNVSSRGSGTETCKTNKLSE